MAEHKKPFAVQSDSHPQDFHAGRRELTGDMLFFDLCIHQTHTHTLTHVLVLNLTNGKKNNKKHPFSLKLAKLNKGGEWAQNSDAHV